MSKSCNLYQTRLIAAIVWLILSDLHNIFCILQYCSVVWLHLLLCILLHHKANMNPGPTFKDSLNILMILLPGQVCIHGQLMQMQLLPK
jgi:hypothetical protein